MKRLGRLWNKVCTVENGIDAVIDGIRNKKSQRITQRFLYTDPDKYHQVDPQKAAEYIEKILPNLVNFTWKHKAPRYTRRFCPNSSAAKGKWRDLYIPAFDDHIIGHMLMQATMPAFTKGMHPHCCGSVPGRGIRHIVKYVRRWFQSDPESVYFVKLDIRHFFDNINADILLDKLRDKIKDKYVIRAFEQIIRCCPSACPVGFYTSPYFANLYLEKLDWFIEQDLYKIRRGKRVKFVRHYLRYMDDMLLIGSSKNDLRKAVHAVKKYFHEELGLEIKDSWEIKQIGEHTENENGLWRMPNDQYWCDIGGYKFCRDAVIMRDGIFLAAERLARKMYHKQAYSLHDCQSLNSRLGWASHADDVYFLEEYIEPYVDISETRRVIANVDKMRKQQSGKAL